jgi:hypothetical protein
MKSFVSILSLCIIILFSSLTGFGQIRKIPASVTETFKEKYPAASNVEWRDKVSVFMAAFEEDGTKYEARFNSKGEWLNTESRIDENSIPEAVTGGFEKSKYAEWTIEQAYKIQLPGDVVQYRLHVGKTDLQKKNLLFSEKGRLLKDRITL